MFDYSDLARSGTAPTLNYGNKGITHASQESSTNKQSSEFSRPKTRDITGTGTSTDLLDLNTSLRINQRMAPSPLNHQGSGLNIPSEISESFRKSQNGTEFNAAVDRIRNPISDITIDRRLDRLNNSGNGVGKFFSSGNNGISNTKKSQLSKSDKTNFNSNSDEVEVEESSRGNASNKPKRLSFSFAESILTSNIYNSDNNINTSSTNILGRKDGTTGTEQQPRPHRSREVRKPPTPKFPSYKTSGGVLSISDISNISTLSTANIRNDNDKSQVLGSINNLSTLKNAGNSVTEDTIGTYSSYTLFFRGVLFLVSYILYSCLIHLLTTNFIDFSIISPISITTIK